MQKKEKKLGYILIVVLAIVLIVTGCAQNKGNSSASKESSAAGNSASPSQSQQATAGESEEPLQLERTKVKAITLSDSIHVGIMKLAAQLGYFESEGLEVEFIDTSGGVQAAPAVLNGSADFGDVAFSHVLKFQANGQPLLAIGQTMNDLGIYLSYSNSWLEKTGVNENSSLEDKVMALKGARIGVTSTGSLTDEVARYFLKEYGMDPDKDATIVGVGSNNLLTALEGGSVDVSVGFSHFPEYIESKGVGKIIIRTRDVAELSGITNLVIVVNSNWVAKHPNTAKAFMRAISKAITYMKSDFESAVEAAQKTWPSIPEDVMLAATINRLSVTPNTPHITPEGAEMHMNWMLDAGSLDQAVDLAKTFDNSYLE